MAKKVCANGVGGRCAGSRNKTADGTTKGGVEERIHAVAPRRDTDIAARGTHGATGKYNTVASDSGCASRGSAAGPRIAIVTRGGGSSGRVSDAMSNNVATSDRIGNRLGRRERLIEVGTYSE